MQSLLLLKSYRKNYIVDEPYEQNGKVLFQKKLKNCISLSRLSLWSGLHCSIDRCYIALLIAVILLYYAKIFTPRTEKRTE